MIYNWITFIAFSKLSSDPVQFNAYTTKRLNVWNAVNAVRVLKAVIVLPAQILSTQARDSNRIGKLPLIQLILWLPEVILRSWLYSSLKLRCLLSVTLQYGELWVLLQWGLLELPRLYCFPGFRSCFSSSVCGGSVAFESESKPKSLTPNPVPKLLTLFHLSVWLSKFDHSSKSFELFQFKQEQCELS